MNDYQDCARARRQLGTATQSPADELISSCRTALATSSSGRRQVRPLSTFGSGSAGRVRSRNNVMKGSLIVYKSSVNGIWAYEWMPANVPETVGDDPMLKRLLDRLEQGCEAPAPL